jgi:hypothetical protein
MAQEWNTRMPVRYLALSRGVERASRLEQDEAHGERAMRLHHLARGGRTAQQEQAAADALPAWVPHPAQRGYVTFTYIPLTLVWCPGQNKRIAPLSFLHGCHKRRLKE